MDKTKIETVPKSNKTKRGVFISLVCVLIPVGWGLSRIIIARIVERTVVDPLIPSPAKTDQLSTTSPAIAVVASNAADEVFRVTIPEQDGKLQLDEHNNGRIYATAHLSGFGVFYVKAIGPGTNGKWYRQHLEHSLMVKSNESNPPIELHFGRPGEKYELAALISPTDPKDWPMETSDLPSHDEHGGRVYWNKEIPVITVHRPALLHTDIADHR